MEAIRVALVTSGSTDTPNGASNYTFRLANLIARRHELDLLVCNPLPDGRLQPRVNCIVLPSESHIQTIRSLKFNMALRRIDLLAYDVVWGISFDGFAMPRRSRRPAFVSNLLGVIAREWLVNARSFKPWEVGALASMPILAGAEFAAANKSSLVVTPSRYSADHSVRLYGLPPSRIHVLPNFIENSFAEKAPPPRKTAAPSVLFVGALASRKRLDILLSAWREVTAQLPSAVLHVVGRGPMESNYRRFAERRLPPKSFQFHGHIPDADLVSLYQASWASCLPSDLEGFGLVSIESQALGTPVVVSPKGALTETLLPGVTGVVAPHQTSEAFAAIILRLLSDPATCIRMGGSARDFVLDHFTETKIEPLVDNLIRTVSERTVLANPPPEPIPP
jgi:glycosyltransferase involved in cell wall biosynthesis